MFLPPSAGELTPADGYLKAVGSPGGVGSGSAVGPAWSSPLALVPGERRTPLPSPLKHPMRLENKPRLSSRAGKEGKPYDQDFSLYFVR